MVTFRSWSVARTIGICERGSARHRNSLQCNTHVGMRLPGLAANRGPPGATAMACGCRPLDGPVSVGPPAHVIGVEPPHLLHSAR